MRKHSEKEASTPGTCSGDEIAYAALRQNIGELQKRCVNLLEVLDAETSQGLSTSKRLEEAISEASE